MWFWGLWCHLCYSLSLYEFFISDIDGAKKSSKSLKVLVINSMGRPQVQISEGYLDGSGGHFFRNFFVNEL